MLRRFSTILRRCFGAADEAPTAPGLAADAFLLRWAAMSVSVLAVVVALQACRVFAWLDERQLRVLAGHPFYLSAEDAQVSLFSQGGMFAVCVGIALYLGAALLMQPRMGRRNHLCLLAAVALGLPGLLCVLWHGVLYVGQPLVCVLLLWLFTVPFALLARRLFS